MMKKLRLKNMWKYLEAGIISLICCVTLAAVLAWSNYDVTRRPDSSIPPANISHSSTLKPVLQPIIPRWELPKDLPTITPEQTRSNVSTETNVHDSLLLATPSEFFPPESFAPESFAQGSGDLGSGENFGDGRSGRWSAYPQYKAQIAPSNYGDRYAVDAQGKPAQNEILVVLHETTSSAESAIHTFQTHHPKDQDQVSYHALILLDGRIVHLVDPAKRAYGAGNSEFKGKNGVESVQTSKKNKPSVNNFAYHISLETPLDGQDKPTKTHSGYTLSQYDALAWLVSQLQIDPDRITTHRDIDRNRDRLDPRSFDMPYFQALLTSY